MANPLRKQDSVNALAGTTNRLTQDALNIIAGTTGLSKRDALNAIVGTTGQSSQDCANLWAGTTGLETQEALDRVATPFATSGLKAWYDASRSVYETANSLLAANGRPVAQWKDLSGNGNHLTEATNKPTLVTNAINGRPVVRGNGTTSVLTAAGLGTGWSSSLGSIFIVFNPQGDTQYGLLQFSSATNTFGRYTDGNGYWGPFRAVRLEITPTGMPTTGNHLYSAVSGANYDIYAEGANVGSVAANFGVPANLTVFNEPGGGLFGAVDIAELIMYNTALTVAQRRSVEAYLATKYAITVS